MLSAGDRLGSYEVSDPLGAGGMGEVYRAKDTKLGREVALKILPATFTSDPERLARFRREAQVLASLNHPHIAQIYGLEEANATQFLVLELVDGESLDRRIARGRVSVDEALGIAKQIAEALEAAHEKGIIHRDLKPANIALTRDGNVKVLDFGLAKVVETTGSPSLDVTNSPTITTPAIMTGVGIILGTAAYMSPEQAKGRPADKRSDVWAFGCVLYEMLTGTRAFDGEDVSDTLANVLKAQPNWALLPTNVSTSVRVLLDGCLRKQPAGRVADISTTRFVLEELSALPTPPDAPTVRRKWIVGVGLAIAMFVAAAIVIGRDTRRGVMIAPAVARFALSLNPPDRLPPLDQSHRVVDISPDGTHIVFVGNRQIYVRRIDELEVIPLRGTAEATTSDRLAGPADPFFSPDGQWVGFWQGGQLKKVPIDGGAATVVCTIPRPTAGVSWATDNTILFGMGPEGVWRVSSKGGSPQPIVPVPAGHGALNPQLIASNRVLYTQRTLTGGTRDQLIVYAVDTGARQVIVDNGSAGRYLPSGHVLYVTDGTLRAIPFDVAASRTTGSPISLVEGVAQSTTYAAAHYAVSQTGSLVFVPEQITNRTLVWVDRQGREDAIDAPPRRYAFPRLSPDGTQIAVGILQPEKDRGLWVWDAARKSLARLATGRAIYPIWTRDGHNVVFAANEGVQRQAADGSGSPERLFSSPDITFPDAMTVDGKEMLVEQRTQTALRQQFEVNIVSIGGDHRVTPLLAGTFNERSATLSPDGRWIAYVSDESGSDEVYVRPFPHVDQGRWPISIGGGRDPVWAQNGRELFYMAPGGRLMAVTVRTEPTLVADRPIQLFEGYEPTLGLPGRQFDVAPDAKRFLFLRETSSSANTQLIVVENWLEELKARVPIK